VRAARLAADVVQDGAHFRVDVRHLVEQLAKPAEIVPVPAEMRHHEAGLRVLLEQAIALRDQLLEARKLVGRIAPIAEQRQLEPPLVLEIDRLEELLRLRRVDEHRDVQARAGVPHGIEVGIVDLEERAVGLARSQAERLADLADADGAGFEIGLQLGDRFLRPARSDVAQIDAGQDADTFLVRRRAERFHHALEVGAGDVVGGDEQPDVQFVECRDQSGNPFGCSEPAACVAVIIDDRKLRLLRRVRRRDQRVPRTVIDDAGRRELRRLTRPRPGHRHSRRTFLAFFDLDYVATTAAAACLLAARRLPLLLLLLLLRRLLRDKNCSANRDDSPGESCLQGFTRHEHSCDTLTVSAGDCTGVPRSLSEEQVLRPEVLSSKF
jgi:hypothetical protein